MRAPVLFACASLTLAAAGACASSDDENATPTPTPDSGTNMLPDAAGNDASTDASPDVELGLPTCSAAGWCTTTLPDGNLVMKDIWPHPDRAFALAESPTLGVKVLEWEDATAEWKYIDDNTQNEDGFSQYAGTIWSPSDHEIYFAVAPNIIYHGTRPAPPEVGWSWSRSRLPDNSHSDEPAHAKHDHARPDSQLHDSVSLGVWGTGTDDVYAWYANTIFHRDRTDAGADVWLAEHIVEDHDVSDEHLFFVSAAGAGPEEVWFSGGRSTGPYYDCPLLVRKTYEGYRRIVDGIVGFDFNEPCSERPGTVFVGGARGWLTDVQPLGDGALVGLKGTFDVAHLAPDGDDYSASWSTVPHNVPSSAGSRSGYSSLFNSSGELWLTGWGLVVRSTAGGPYEVSTISLNGGPINSPFYRVRGTSKTNLWAIGARYAFHKTTP